MEMSSQWFSEGVGSHSYSEGPIDLSLALFAEMGMGLKSISCGSTDNENESSDEFDIAVQRTVSLDSRSSLLRSSLSNSSSDCNYIQRSFSDSRDDHKEKLFPSIMIPAACCSPAVTGRKVFGGRSAVAKAIGSSSAKVDNFCDPHANNVPPPPLESPSPRTPVDVRRSIGPSHGGRKVVRRGSLTTQPAPAPIVLPEVTQRRRGSTSW